MHGWVNTNYRQLLEIGQPSIIHILCTTITNIEMVWTHKTQGAKYLLSWRRYGPQGAWGNRLFTFFYNMLEVNANFREHSFFWHAGWYTNFEAHEKN